MTMEDFMCNVLIMGKTGTGKSTLLNYLIDSAEAPTGTGKPVTGEGIYEYTAKIRGQEIRIFDSWGIEAGKVDRWNALIKNALEKHGVQCSIAEWFHSVIYCIQAGGGRVEDIDVEIINKFLNEGYKVTIVLTKADQIDEDDEAQMRDVIIQGVSNGKKVNNLNVIATCAQQKKTRSGMTEPFGRDEVCMAILNGWKDTVVERLPKHVVARICQIINQRAEKIKKDALPKVQGLAVNNEPLYGQVGDRMQYITEDLQDVVIPQILKEAAEMCHKADMKLSVIFEPNEVSLEPTNAVTTVSSLPTPRDKKYSWGKFAWDAVTTVAFGLIGLGIKKTVGFFVNKNKDKKYQEALCQQNHDQSNIEAQKLELSESIDRMAQEICDEYRSQESKLACQLEKAING